MPAPVSTQKLKGAVVVDSRTALMSDAGLAPQRIYLSEEVYRQCGILLQATDVGGTRIELRLDSIRINRPEMYELLVQEGRVRIVARDRKGIVNGIQTLLQLLPFGKGGAVPGVQITDYPRFAYRGAHLDVARHIFSLDYIKKYIDYLAFHKLNTFHWHLTDDQGWRIEMLSYPKLNTIGSWREATLIGHFRDVPARYDSTRYGGYYTRDQIKEVLDYAAIRGIQVIPEIDIPGHSRAIIAAYPEFSTNPDTTWNVATTWGMYNRQNNVLAPNEATFRFLQTIFSEIADLFPGPYIHIGGDECSTIWWKRDPKTQAFMRRNNIPDETALQAYFVAQVAATLHKKGKRIIGWHEVMQGNIDKSTIIMNWADDKKGAEAVHRGYSVIMTPGKPLYFDHFGEKHSDSLSIHGYNSLRAVYAYEPVPANVKGIDRERILGAQSNLWTEYIEYPTKVDYMIFPRLTALSEVLWSPKEKRNYSSFTKRLKQYMVPRYKLWGSHYSAKSIRE